MNIRYLVLLSASIVVFAGCGGDGGSVGGGSEDGPTGLRLVEYDGIFTALSGGNGFMADSASCGENEVVTRIDVFESNTIPEITGLRLYCSVLELVVDDNVFSLSLKDETLVKSFGTTTGVDGGGLDCELSSIVTEIRTELDNSIPIPRHAKKVSADCTAVNLTGEGGKISIDFADTAVVEFGPGGGVITRATDSCSELGDYVATGIRIQATATQISGIATDCSKPELIF
jgi:hypothetical protein